MYIDLDLPTTILGFALAIFFAWIAVRMARKRGRETLIWGALGFFFPCLTLIVLWIIGDARDKYLHERAVRRTPRESH